MDGQHLPRAVWRKSSRSGGNGGNCVEVALLGGDILTNSHKTGDSFVAVRDSKDTEGPVLAFTPDEWEAFIDGVKAGEFDLRR
jgi:hypothetical protein